MKVNEVLERLNSGVKLVDLEKELNITSKGLGKALRQIGCFFDNSTKVWDAGTATAETLESSIFDYAAQRGNNRVTKVSHKDNTEVKDSSHKSSHTSNTDAHKNNKLGELKFTPEEIAALKEMARQHISEKNAETQHTRLQKRIMELPKRTKANSKRKTVVVLDEVAEKFDAFTDKLPFDKSDIFQLAMLDFMRKYEGEGE